ATRVNHFAAIPDASWAVFFIGGFYLATWTRWASVLVLLLAATRVNHFAAIPDASWAVFFIGGFYLATWTRWA
ncbi:hypothetical protein C7E18_24085, partial [Stenotrophomonas maltophilia]